MAKVDEAGALLPGRGLGAHNDAIAMQYLSSGSTFDPKPPRSTR